MSKLIDEIKKVAELSEVPMKTEQETRRVEIIMLTFNQPDVEIEAVSRIIKHTSYPYKLVLYDNRPNTANTSRIWNKLIKESTCDYVLIMDSDAYVQGGSPCWLTKMMESIEETGIVIPVSDAPGGANQQKGAELPYPATQHNNGIWSGYCFLVDKKIFEKYGYFDERFYIYGQDSEFAYRTRKAGATMRTDTLVRHIGGATFCNNSLREADKEWAKILYRRICQ